MGRTGPGIEASAARARDVKMEVNTNLSIYVGAIVCTWSKNRAPAGDNWSTVCVPEHFLLSIVAFCVSVHWFSMSAVVCVPASYIN